MNPNDKYERLSSDRTQELTYNMGFYWCHNLSEPTIFGIYNHNNNRLINFDFN